MTNSKTVIQKVSPSKKMSGGHKDACIVIISGNNLGKIVTVDEKSIFIGRNQDCAITCNDPLTSRVHAEIFWKNNLLHIRYLDSTNGTFLNFEDIDDKEVMLNNGDKISVGETIFKFLTHDSIEKEFHDELYKLAVLDGLTQIYNRKHFDIIIQQEFSRAIRYENNLSLVICDIDNFKHVNDEYGHQAGDYVLREVSKILLQNIRDTDTLARYGGEEFVMIFHGVSEIGATECAEKIRKVIENTIFQFENTTIPITMSFGVGYVYAGIQNPDELIKLADENLYAAKENGRNQVVGYLAE